MSSDPAMESYIPEASSNEGADERNQNLPGMGGVYNSRNLQTYHYAGNNPLKYTDPNGKWIWVAVAGVALVLTSCSNQSEQERHDKEMEKIAKLEEEIERDMPLLVMARIYDSVPTDIPAAIALTMIKTLELRMHAINDMLIKKEADRDKAQKAYDKNPTQKNKEYLDNLNKEIVELQRLYRQNVSDSIKLKNLLNDIEKEIEKQEEAIKAIQKDIDERRDRGEDVTELQKNLDILIASTRRSREALEKARPAE